MGWVSEIARGYYRWAGSDQITTQELMQCDGFDIMPEFESLFEAWRKEVLSAQSASGIHIPDLFYWENRVARWCGASLNVLNTGSNWVALFSFCDLLEAMFRVREREEVGRQQALHRKVAHELEPRLDKIEPNPMTIKEILAFVMKTKFKNFILSCAIRAGVDKFLSRRRYSNFLRFAYKGEI